MLDILRRLDYTNNTVVICRMIPEWRNNLMDSHKIQLHNIDFEDFIKAIDNCKGDVYLETEDGDVLNLKSRLCQMIGLATILKHSEVGEATVRCTNPDDETALFRYNLYGEMPEKK